jgi:hypothetical protein
MKYVVIFAALLVSCATPQDPAIDSAKLVDLSYSFDENTVDWPNAEGFRHRKDTWTTTPGGYWYAAGEFTSAEHGGTLQMVTGGLMMALGGVFFDGTATPMLAAIALAGLLACGAALLTFRRRGGPARAA